MRELNQAELDQVNGGVVFIYAATWVAGYLVMKWVESQEP